MISQEFFKNVVDGNCFVIAEIGQNHQGSIETAKQLIRTAKECGADCVKFQKTALQEKFTTTVLKRPYVNKNSWGNTYGEHKSYLEFTEDQFRDLQKYAKSNGILFSASAMDLISLKFLLECDVPFVKIGSGDANNFILLEAAAESRKPLIVSTGMQDLDTVDKIYGIISKYHKYFFILHCVSSYPAPVEDINLNVIKLFQQRYPDVQIGYSGHEIGIDVSLAAIAIGAKVIERHITLDRNQKGSDHICSLEPDEFKEMVQKIRLIENALGKPEKKIRNSELPCLHKLGKSVVAAAYTARGTRLEQKHLKIKVAEPKGIDPTLIDTLVGKITTTHLDGDEPILEKHFS